jgi:hypothetical protein
MVWAAQTLIPVLAWIIGLGLPFFVVWLGTRWIPKHWARIYARVVITPALWYVVTNPLMWFVADPLGEGDWRCFVCGAVEHRVEYRRWVLQRGPVSPSRKDELGSPAFRLWYDREIGKPHEHDWMPIGCHYSAAGRVSCSESPGWPFYEVLPRLPDPKVAEALVDRLQRADHEERWRMIRDFEWSQSDSPFHSIMDGRVMTREAFDVAYASWLSGHPAWQ